MRPLGIFVVVVVIGGMLAMYGLGTHNGDASLKERNQALVNDLVDAHCLLDKQWVQTNEYKALAEAYANQLDIALEALEQR